MAFTTDEVVQLVVARTRLRIVWVTPFPGVPKVVRFVDHDGIRQAGDPLEPLGVLQRGPREVRVAEHGQVREVSRSTNAADVSEVSFELRHPNRVLDRLRGEQDDALVLVEDEPLEQHEADEGLAETNAVAQKRPAVLARNAHHRPVGLLLVPIQLGEHP